MSKVLIIRSDKYFLSQDNFYPNPFKEISSPFGYWFDQFTLKHDAFIFWLDNFKEEWKSFLKLSSEFKNSNKENFGEHFSGVLYEGKIPELKYISVQEIKTENGGINKYLYIENDAYDITSYPFVIVRCRQVFFPDRINFSRILKSGGRDYAFISWDALPLTPLETDKKF
ncbi:hypothetical protein PQ692_14490 (plasmid) [Thermoanaerobacterium thermosaccharolyticum]|jgi:hypothetical protein|uniref:hypothetical protein n=1 Tax=Thermoanaerobacterium thermosaccharolyticum TaxID=1517 RepID=UPI003D265C12